ncbi:MAG: ATP phosphoribosyltransferase regulatory subunit [Candidatus Dormibacteria bacterium]
MKLQRSGAPAARPAGLVDQLPGEAAGRRRLEQTIVDVFGGWGYELVSTPSLELLETVELGLRPEESRRLFKFADADGRMLALVGERTVSVARVAAGQLQAAPRPLRLCYLGSTFAGHAAPGGRREAFQAGAELIGVHSAVADAEVVAMAIRALAASGLTEFQVEVGHVGFFGGLMDSLPEERRALVHDSLVGRDLVELEEALAGTELRAAEQELLLRFPALRGGEEILDAAAGMVGNATSAEALRELGEVARLLDSHGVRARVNLDLGAVRDFDYYSGCIFEVFAPGVGAPVAVGGRYDGLLQHFGEDEPATGVVIFLDRVQDALGRGSGVPPHQRLVMVGFAGDPAPALQLAAELRRRGRRVVTTAAPGDEDQVRLAARRAAADETVFCLDGGNFLLDGAGRTPLSIDLLAPL